MTNSEIISLLSLAVVGITLPLYLRYDTNRGKLKFLYSEELNEEHPDSVEYTRYTVLKIVNAGERERSINSIKVEKKYFSNKKCITRTCSYNNPVALSKGQFQIFKVKTSINSPLQGVHFDEDTQDAIFYDQTDENENVSSIRVVVTDTLGKSYNSKWIKVQY